MSAARAALLESDCMARTCTICTHPKLVNIDRQLLRGDMLNGIAHRFHVSPDAVGRHRRHMRTAMLAVNLQTISPEEALEYARDILELFSPAAALQPELPMPLIEGETDISATEELHDNN